MAIRTLADVDWESWNPVDRATLTFVVRAGEILLISKKRGLGAGKINGPGGRIEAGETPDACAVREVEEELLTTPQAMSAVGELLFQFADGYSLHCYVYRAQACSAEPNETDEARPIWVALDAVPYDEMWADDRHWLPLMLDGKTFYGRFVFDGDTMLDHEIAEGWTPGG